MSFQNYNAYILNINTMVLVYVLQNNVKITFIVNHENENNTCYIQVTHLSPFPATESQQTTNNAFGSYSLTYRMNTFRERGVLIFAVFKIK